MNAFSGSPIDVPLGRQPSIYMLICTCAYVCIDIYTYIYMYIISIYIMYNVHAYV